ncbi:hypothetical protein DFH27DRAFT_527210 [Peziza echinospora]|nr:hypothetical protein DFH27DRAFT_527210 [Peziza echinospora]
MNFNGLRELDTLYAQKPAQPTPASAFSFFDGLSSPQPPGTPSAAAFSAPQRPSSVCLPSQSGYRGPTPMARTHSNSIHNDTGSAFEDLMSLFDNGPPIKSAPVNILKQAPGRSPSPQLLKRKSSVGAKDPFASLSGASGLRSSFTPTSSSPQLSWGSFSGSASKSPIPPTPEADDDFGDFASASNSPVKTPTIPTRSLQDGGRRSLSISTPSIPNIRGFSTSPKPPTNNNNLLNINFNGSGSLLNTPITPPLLTSRSPTPEPPADDDFGDFIATPITSTHPPITKSQPKPSIPSTYPPSKPPTTHVSHPSITSLPLSLPLPTSTTTTTTTTSTKPTHNNPPLPPLSAILSQFPHLLLLPTTHLFQKLTKHPYPLRQRILSQPQTHTFLLGTCEIVRVIGRLIAGRRQRGRSPGASIRQKEDREISELVRTWKEDVYARVKSALIRPNTSHTPGGGGGGGGGGVGGVVVPELDTDLRAEKVPGAGANILDEEEEGCRLCGLQRDEVVRKLHEMEERGSEKWWVSGWGHRGCRNWWERWEGEVVKEVKKVKKG